MLHFTSDLHYNHPNIIKYCNRPWDVEQQNEILLRRWNSYIDVNDTVYFCGDLFFYMTFEEQVEVLSKMNGKKHLIPGNHDNEKYFKAFMNHPKTKVVEVERLIELKVNKQLYVMCHYPLESWNKQGGGSYMIHGHCHGSLPSRGLRLDVGIDNHPDLGIYSIEQVNQIMGQLKLTGE